MRILLLLLLLPVCRAQTPADLLFLNGNIYTVNAAAPHAEAIAIKGERILFAGPNEQARKYSGAATSAASR